MIQKINGKVIYESKWIRLREDQVRFPDGSEGVYAYTERVDEGPMIIPVNEKGEMLVLREWRYPIQDWVYQFPAGGHEEGEDSLTTAKRELEEETGLCASEWVQIGTFYCDPGSHRQKTQVFLARGLSKGEKHLDASEVHETRWIKTTDIDRMIEKEIVSGWLLSGMKILEAFLKSDESYRAE